MKKAISILTLTFIMIYNYSFSQKTDTITQKQIESKHPLKIDSTKKELYLKGGITVTNKGISYIPNLSLGKPAIIFDLSIGGKKLSLEPQLRFALNAEPWAFLFPVRYKIKSKGKFKITAGINPLLNFKSVTYTVNGVSTTDLINRRYLGGELKPNYFFTKSTSIGLVYLYFSGVSDRAVKHTHFVSLNANFSNIKFGEKFFVKFNPQIYYLNQDSKEGYYVNSVVTLLKRNFPLSIQTNMNAAIQTNIPSSENFIWNISLIYAFDKVYVQK